MRRNGFGHGLRLLAAIALPVWLASCNFGSSGEDDGAGGASVVTDHGGHSLTLALVTLGLVRVSPALMELGIALSLVVVARELLRQRPSVFGRRSGVMALAFGLLHGMGFAGALGEVGLPAGEIPLALLAFNLGIELGQLALVAAVFSAAFALRLLPRAAELGRRAAVSAAPAYAIGGMAMLWCIERLGPAARLLG